MNTNVDDDMKIIRGIVSCEHIDFNDLGWINCNLHNADIDDFENRRDYDKAIKTNDEFLFIFLIIYNFEKGGFDLKLECKRQCNWYKKDSKNNRVKTHPVSVLLALNELKEEYSADSIDQLLKIENLADKWFKKAKSIHKSKFKRCFNERGFNSKYLESLIEFYKSGKIKELRKFVIKNQFDKAHDLILQNIRGIGPKLAKFIVRDLAFSLTEWGKSEKLDWSWFKDPEILRYIVPIDRWVRRISLSIPLICSRLKKELKCSDLADNTNRSLDEKLSLTISKVCYEMKLNPMRFDLGAFLFGVYEIQKRAHISEIYEKLKEKFL